MRIAKIQKRIKLCSAIAGAVVGFVFSSNLALAATAYLVPNFESAAVGDTVIISVEMNTEGKKPNVVEGNILVKSGIEKVEISKFILADSVLTFWPRSPSLDEKSLISFTGGIPGGFNNKSGLLFKIAFLAKAEGQVVFLPDSIKAYDNDGKATPIQVSSSPLTIDIGPKVAGQQKDQWSEIIFGDKEGPQGLTAAFGQDSSVFEGKKFITLSAIDNQSGIDYYLVAEGNWPAVRSGEEYVLLDQTESSDIIITAYDKAGNYSKILLSPGKAKVSYWKLAVFLVIALVVFSGLIYILAKTSLRIFKILKKRKIRIDEQEPKKD